MSSLGFLSVYSLINSDPGGLCERFFLPQGEERALSRERGRPLGDFGLIAGSLSFENDYHLFLRILKAGRVPVEAKDRDERIFPAPVVAGGIGVWSNPFPLAPFADLILTGEGELSWPVILDLHGDREFGRLRKTEKISVLAANVPGALAPSLCPELFDEEAGFDSFARALARFKPVVPPRLSFKKGDAGICSESFEHPPNSPIFAKDAEFSGTRLIEISRGCPYGCRFCLAGSLYRPHRFWDGPRILKAIDAPNPWDGLNPFPDDAPVGLVSPAVADHPDLNYVVSRILEKKRKISFSSLRLSALTEETARLFSEGKLAGLAVAPEGGTERIRRTMNKDITEEEILSAVKLLSRVSLRKLKLYFMLGLPGETDEDVRGIAELAEKIRKASFGKSRAPLISASVANFTPKPHTPFEDVPSLSFRELARRGELLKTLMKRAKGVELRLDSPWFSLVQDVLGRSGPNGASFLRELLKNDGKAKASLKAWNHEGREEETSSWRALRPWRIVAPPTGVDWLEREKENGAAGIFSPACPGALSCGRCEACPKV
jgi:radical SAM superfamily enzyme YgiQ (UPF0313 family)